MVVIKAADIAQALQDAVNAGFIAAHLVQSGNLYALSILITTGGFTRFIQPYMNKANMPYLYFVQKYLHRRQLHERVRVRAYYLWIERGRLAGYDWRDWFDAEQVILAA